MLLKCERTVYIENTLWHALWISLIVAVRKTARATFQKILVFFKVETDQKEHRNKLFDIKIQERKGSIRKPLVAPVLP